LTPDRLAIRRLSYKRQPGASDTDPVHDHTSSPSGDVAGTKAGGEERRRREELPPDIVALIASCGEKVRRTDSVAVQTGAADRTAAPAKPSS